MIPSELANALKYGEPLHRKIADALRNRLRLSEGKMRSRYTQMAQNEELFQAYIPERDVDALRRLNRESNGVPEYRTIEIPHSYAVLMTAHTYFSSVFLSRNPVLQLMARHGEPEMRRAAIETLLAYQVSIGQMLVPLYIWLLDPGKYGYGVIGHHWDSDTVRVRTFQEVPVTFMGVPIGNKTKTQEVVEEVPGYEGNRVFNVRPQDFFPDPRVALAHFQKGEFCARYSEVPWNEIYEGQSTGRYFNYPTLLRMKQTKEVSQDAGQINRDTGGRTTELPGSQAEEAGYDVPVGFVKGHEIFMKLVPKDWRLGSGDKQEIWVFNITSNGVIFGAMPLGELHGKFPFDVLLDEVDGYTITPHSTLERCKPLNDVLTWLINTHFYNVRAAMNNQLVVDPSMIVMKDAENPDPGKLIRLKPEAYGKDVRTAITQLQVMDVTRTHIGGDLNVIIDFLARMTGTSDNIMGMINSGGRKTATEVRQSTSFGVNRLKTMCEWHSAVGWAPFTQKLVQSTQQHYRSEKQFRIVGDLAQFSPNLTRVTPADIAGFFDYEPVDGTLPVDRFAQANLWQMIMGQMKEYPQIMATYDIAKIFAWVAQLAGIKNMTQFRLIPNGTVGPQVQSGNVVPLSAAMKETNLNEPGQVPNLGATG